MDVLAAARPAIFKELAAITGLVKPARPAEPRPTKLADKEPTAAVVAEFKFGWFLDLQTQCLRLSRGAIMTLWPQTSNSNEQEPSIVSNCIEYEKK